MFCLLATDLVQWWTWSHEPKKRPPLVVLKSSYALVDLHAFRIIIFPDICTPWVHILPQYDLVNNVGISILLSHNLSIDLCPVKSSRRMPRSCSTCFNQMTCTSVIYMRTTNKHRQILYTCVGFGHSLLYKYWSKQQTIYMWVCDIRSCITNNTFLWLEILLL